MGELERHIRARREQVVRQAGIQEEYARRQQELQNTSLERSREFIEIMVKKDVGKAALYDEGSTKRRIGFTRREIVVPTFDLIGAGWVVPDKDSEGFDQDMIVLDTNETYRCYPDRTTYDYRFRKEVPDSNYVLLAPMQTESIYPFGEPNGLSILAKAVELV